MFWKNCGKAALMLSCRDYSRGQPVQVGVVQSRLNHGITQQPKKKKNGSDKKYNKRNCLSYSISYHKVSVIKYLKHFHIQLLYSIQLLYLLFSSSIFCVYYVEIEQNINFTQNFVAGMMVIHQSMMVKPCCCFSLEKSHFV